MLLIDMLDPLFDSLKLVLHATGAKLGLLASGLFISLTMIRLYDLPLGFVSYGLSPDILLIVL